MEQVCNDTLQLLTKPSKRIQIDFNYQVNGFSIQNFYELHCGNDTESGANGTGEDDLFDPEYFSHTYRLVGTLFQGMIFLIGLIGNIMVVLVVAKTKSMHSPTNCYLVSLALADIIVLLAAVPNEILSYYLVGGKWLYGEWGCSIFVFSQNLGINASTLSLTAFTVERYIAICHPMKAQTMCTVSRAKRIICGVWFCSIIYCLPWLGLTKLEKLPYRGFDDTYRCTFKLSRDDYTYYYLTDFVVFYVVPLLLSVVLYGLIARVLFQSHLIKTNSSTFGGKLSTNGTGPLTVDSTKTNAARVQVVKMLGMVVVIFAVLWLPYRGMLVYNSFAKMFAKEIFLDLWFLMLAKTCIYINSAINPILYNAMSVKFRRAFSRTLFCGKRRPGSSFNTYGAYYGRGTHTTYSTAACTTSPFHPTSSSTLASCNNSSATSSTNNSINMNRLTVNNKLLSNKCKSSILKNNLVKQQQQQQHNLLQYQMNKKNSHHHPSHHRHHGHNCTYDSIEVRADSTDTIYTCHDQDQPNGEYDDDKSSSSDRGSSAAAAKTMPAIVDYDDDFIDRQVVTQL